MFLQLTPDENSTTLDSLTINLTMKRAHYYSPRYNPHQSNNRYQPRSDHTPYYQYNRRYGEDGWRRGGGGHGRRDSREGREENGYDWARRPEKKTKETETVESKVETVVEVDNGWGGKTAVKATTETVESAVVAKVETVVKVEVSIPASIQMPRPPDSNPMQPDRTELRAKIRSIMQNMALTPQDKNKLVMTSMKNVELVTGPAPNDVWYGGDPFATLKGETIEYRLEPFRWPNPERCLRQSGHNSDWVNWRLKHPN